MSLRRSIRWLRQQWAKVILGALALYVIGPTLAVEPGVPATVSPAPVRTPCPSFGFGFDPFCSDYQSLPDVTHERRASAVIYTTHPALRLVGWVDGMGLEGFAICNAPAAACH